MWSSRRPHHPPPFFEPPVMNGPAGMYPNLSNPSPAGQVGVPTLSHRGVPSPNSTPSVPPSAPYQYSGGPPMPNYGFQVQPPAAGAVPQYPYPNQTQPYGMDVEEWVTVSHGSPFPVGAVQAMDRPLSNNDETAKNSYVALWTKNGEPVFGRAWNNRGKVEAWFPHGDHEHHSGTIPSFQLLTSRGPPFQNFRYAWVQANQINSMCQPVRKGDYSPAVLRDLRLRNFNGELLGKANLARRMAWVSYAGKEHYFDDDQVYSNCFILCRVPL